MSSAQLLPADLFRGRTVFITGGAGDINLAIGEAFAAHNANVGLCGRTGEKLDKARVRLESLGARVSTAVADVRNYDDLEAGIKRCGEECGPVCILVCAAAGNFLAPAEALSPNGFKSVVDIDLLGSFNACRAAFDQLRQTRGSIIFISAGQAFAPYFAQSHVGAAKAGVDNLMQNLALEWGRFGIRSNSIAPGAVDETEGMRRIAPGQVRERLASEIPLRRLGTVGDIANAAMFLASPLASYVTGTRLVVDGGMHLPGSGLFSKMIANALGGRAASDQD